MYSRVGAHRNAQRLAKHSVTKCEECVRHRIDNGSTDGVNRPYVVACSILSAMPRSRRGCRGGHEGAVAGSSAWVHFVTLGIAIVCMYLYVHLVRFVNVGTPLLARLKRYATWPARLRGDFLFCGLRIESNRRPNRREAPLWLVSDTLVCIWHIACTCTHS